MALFNKNQIPRTTPAAVDARNGPANGAHNRAPSMLGIATDPSIRPPLAPGRGAAHGGVAASSAGGDRAGASKLIVGRDIGLEGATITDCDTLVVEGKVKAEIKSRVIEIADGGRFEGTVEVDEAIVSGRFDGELTARRRLHVHPTGEVTGKIRYGTLAIEEGGRVQGDLGYDEAAPAAKRRGRETEAPETHAAE